MAPLYTIFINGLNDKTKLVSLMFDFVFCNSPHFNVLIVKSNIALFYFRDSIPCKKLCMAKESLKSKLGQHSSQ